VVGAPDIHFEKILPQLLTLKAPWLQGCFIRPCFFEPTFHKYAGGLCSGLQIHTDHWGYQHERFKPYRIVALILKAIRNNYPDYALWRKFDYEYETNRLAIDLLTGGTFFRTWVDDPAGKVDDFDARLVGDEESWESRRKCFLLY
ncbi:MAG: DUF1343 domain-containing protein, partial [Calditrichaeota bacterium]